MTVKHPATQVFTKPTAHTVAHQLGDFTVLTRYRHGAAGTQFMHLWAMSTRLSGVLTALATPFTPDGQIDENALRRLVDRSIDGGVDGVVACGSTGEFAAMSGAERRFVVETVIEQTANRAPVVAQTGAVSTAEAVELSRHAEAAGASVPDGCRAVLRAAQPRRNR